jgi:AcrR family transcriptional regulator
LVETRALLSDECIVHASSDNVKSSALGKLQCSRDSWQHEGMTVDAATPAQGARARVRAELTEEIKAVARRHLAESGAAALSLRAVARDVGMVSSAVYRYFPSRDELLTALIVDSYLSFGEVVEAAARRKGTAEQRWLALGHAARDWALTRPHEWALLFGSPVPGYAAPGDTIDPAAIAPLAFFAVVADGVAAGTIRSVPGPLPRAVRADLARLRADSARDAPDDVLARAFGAWAVLFGLISLELFGHTHNVITDHAAFFDTQLRAAWTVVAA